MTARQAQDFALYAVAMVALVVLLAGCGPRVQEPNNFDERRSARFQSCMELAAKNSRQADDDVSDIVKACTHWSYL